MSTNTKDLLEEILQYLDSHIEGLEQIVIIQRDGTLLAQCSSGETDDNISEALATFADRADEVCREFERGANTEALIKGKHRFLALYCTRGATTLLGMIGKATVNLGLLNSGARKAIEKIEALITE